MLVYSKIHLPYYWTEVYLIFYFEESITFKVVIYCLCIAQSLVVTSVFVEKKQ